MFIFSPPGGKVRDTARTDGADYITNPKQVYLFYLTPSDSVNCFERLFV